MIKINRKRTFRVLLILFLILFIIMFISAGLARKTEASNDYILEKMTSKARKLNNLRVKHDYNLSSNHKATDEQLKSRIYWLGYYSKKLADNGYHWKRLWKDSYSMVWLESWFVNYQAHDYGKGFGWTAMQWTTAEDMADRYKWNWKEDKKYIAQSTETGNKLQAKYMIGYIMWLYNYYDQDRCKAITGYNKGLNLDDAYVYMDYWLAVSGRIIQLDKWLKL